MKRKLHAGSTSAMLPIFVGDSSSSTAAGLGGLTSATSGLVGEYRRHGSSSWTSISLTSATLGTYTSGGWVADGSLAGAYEVGIPDAALASGVRWVAIRFYGATNMIPVLVEIELDVVDYQNSNFGLTNLDAAVTSRASATDYTSGRAAALDNLDAAVSTRSTYNGGAVASVTGAVGSVTAAVTVSDKTGYKLASDGLDSISTTEATGVAANFREMMVEAWWRLYGKVVKDKNTLTIKVYKRDLTTVKTTQAYTDDGAGNESQGAAS